jgi:hypothetical protein
MSKHRRNQKIGRAAQKLSSASSRLIEILSNGEEHYGQASYLGDALMEISGALELLGLPHGLPGVEHPAFCNLVSRSNMRHHLIALEGESNE